MSVNTINKKTNKRNSYLYSSWVREIIENGLMDDHIILEYPDLVKVVSIEIDGQKRDYKVIARREIDATIKEHPDRFEIIDLDIKKIELEDLNKSRKIKSPLNTTIENSKKTNYKFLNKIYNGLFFVKSTISQTFNFIRKITKYIIKNPIKILRAIVVILTVVYLSIQLYEWYLENYTIRH